ncbi:MAG: YbaK/EbsC family protein [Bacteroidetes bacterium]|nr:YbaK/EbsC family protein [Bacteroidota bacterium]
MSNLRGESHHSLSAKVIHVQNTLQSLGVNYAVVQLQESTRTAQEASKALGCVIGQIVKSLVFSAVDRPILVLASGSNRVYESLLSKTVGYDVTVARADFVLQHTGYSIGGVAPVGHPSPIPTYIDEDLLQYQQVWAAAGGTHAVFECQPAFLKTLGTIIRVH